MIENDFDEKDTAAERVVKLNGQTGLGFILRERGYKGLVYLEREGRHFTGAMGREELMHWTATFALGFRLGHAGAAVFSGRALLTFFRRRRGRVRSHAIGAPRGSNE